MTAAILLLVATFLLPSLFMLWRWSENRPRSHEYLELLNQSKKWNRKF